MQATQSLVSLEKSDSLAMLGELIVTISLSTQAVADAVGSIALFLWHCCFFFFFFNMLMDSTASSCDSLSGSFPWSEHVWSVHRAGCKSLDIHFCLQPPEGLLTSDGSEQVDKELSSAPSPCYYYFSFGIRDLHCSMWDLVPWLGIEPRSPALVVQSCSHWATREAPFIIKKFFFWTMSSGMWDLSSPTRDWTPAPCIGSAES